MANVKFVIEAEAAKLLQEAVKVVTAQKRMENGFAGMAKAGSKATREAETSVERLRRKMQQTAQETSAQAARITVAGTWNQSRGAADLRISQAGRAAAAGGGGSIFAIQSATVMAARSERAAKLRAERLAHRQAEEHGRKLDAMVLRNGVENQIHLSNMARWQARVDRAQQRTAKREADAKERREGAIDGGNALQADLSYLRLEAKDRAKARRQQLRESVAEGVMYVGAAVGTYMQRTRQQLDQTADAITGFDDVMTPLYGVGSNSGRRSALRREVMGSAIVTGTTPQQIAGMRFSLQSQASDRSPAEMDELIRSGIDFYRLQRADMAVTATAIDSAARSLRDELPSGARGIRAVRNKLAYAADVGAFEINEFAPYMSSVASSFKGMGFSGNAALAGSIVASQSGMRAETWTTALRNLPLLMSKAEEKLGRKLPQGDFGAAMKEVATLQSPDLLELVGRDTFAVAKIIGDNADALRAHTEALRKVTADTDQLGTKLRQGIGDLPGTQGAIIRSANAIISNEGVLSLAQGRLAEEATDAKLREAGAAMEISPFFKRIGMGWLATTSEQGLDEIGMSFNNLRNAGARELISQYRTAGQGGDQVAGILSNYLELKYNPDQTYFYKKGDGSKVGTERTGSAEEYLKMATGKYGDLSAGEFVQYQTMLGTDANAANEYLERVGRSSGGASSGGMSQQTADQFAGAVDKLDKVTDRLIQSQNKNAPMMNANR